MTTTKLTRADLYELVWRTPMSRLAGEFGVSDVALAKTCDRLSVPRPGRGYWAQIAAGMKEKRPPLGKALAGTKEWVVVERTESRAPRAPKPETPKVEIPTDLRDAHDAIKQLGAALASAKRDEHERLVVSGRREPVIAVTVAAHRRALLLLAALATAATDRGHGVVLHAEEDAHVLAIVVGDMEVAVSVVERLDRKEHDLTPDERRRADGGYRWGIAKYDYFAAGHLQLLVHDAGGARTSWSDTERRRLDRQLGNVVIAVEAAAERRRQQRFADAERHREQERRRLEEEEEQRRQQDRAMRAQHEERLAVDLRRMARAWAEAREVRSFLAAVRDAIPEAEQPATMVDWLRWAHEHAMSLDPLTAPASIPKEVTIAPLPSPRREFGGDGEGPPRHRAAGPRASPPGEAKRRGDRGGDR